MSQDAPEAHFPLQLDGVRDERTSRALWLVKWLLLIPHYVVLFFMWLTFGVFTVLAFFAILVTGRYPQALFDFNVGVLRWSWRVSFYGYGALGTDRYPPFSLHDDPSYPARLEVERPEHLSRGLVLVKWWLLAIPHYLVIGLFMGVTAYGATNDDLPWTPQVGLIGLLVLFSAVVLLFRRRYPPRLFDLVMGLQRWVYRVAAYATLMTDRYPPFALDQGGTEHRREPEPALAAETPTPETVAPAAAGTSDESVRPAASRKEWTTGRAVSAVVGSTVLVAGLGVFLAGLALAVFDVALEDDDGFLMSDHRALTSSSAAITSESLDMGDGPESFLPESILGDTRLKARPLADRELFIGVGSTDAVRRYLADVPHDTFVDLRRDRPVYRHHSGVLLPAAPQQENFWVSQASGPGPLELTWKPSSGDWTMVVMNADGDLSVAADVSVGAKFPIIGAISAVLLVTAAVCVLVGIVLIVIPLVIISRRRRPS